MKWLVLAVDVDFRSSDFEGLRSGSARRYAPHISILPRCHVSSSVLDRLRKFSPEIFENTWFELRGPKAVNSRLAWYESEFGLQGNDVLRQLHAEALSFASSVNLKPAIEHCGANYRPHLTLVSGTRIGFPESAPSRISAIAKSISAYEINDGLESSITRHIIRDLEGGRGDFVSLM